MYDPKKSWMWGRAFRTYALNEFPPGFRLDVPAAYTGEGIAHEDDQGALRLDTGQQVGRVDRTTGEVLIGRKLRDGDLPGKPKG